jgi:hypothetical protein
MSLKRSIRWTPAVVAVQLIVGGTLAAGAPEGARAEDPPRVTMVFAVPELEVPVAFRVEPKQTIAAGAYDVSLMRSQRGSQRRYYFELKRPGEDEVLARLEEVRVRVLTQRAASRFLGHPDRKKQAQQGEPVPQSPEDWGSEQERLRAVGGGRSIIANVVRGELKFAYRETTDSGSIRVFYASVPIQSQG